MDGMLVNLWHYLLPFFFFFFLPYIYASCDENLPTTVPFLAFFAFFLVFFFFFIGISFMSIDMTFLYRPIIIIFRSLPLFARPITCWKLICRCIAVVPCPKTLTSCRTILLYLHIRVSVAYHLYVTALFGKYGKLLWLVWCAFWLVKSSKALAPVLNASRGGSIYVFCRCHVIYRWIILKIFV